MKKSRFTEAQIMGVLRQAEGGMPVPELRREHGISSAMFYKWRATYGGMDASMMSQMRALVDEMIADLLVGVTNVHKTWGFGVCFLHLRNVKGHAGTTSGSTGFTSSWS